MTKLETGFTTKYEVTGIRSIEPKSSGTFEGKPYSAKVEFRSINIVQIDDPNMGLVEKEINVSFRQECTDSQLRELNNFIRKRQKENKPIYIDGSLPNDAGKNSYLVKSLQSFEDFLSSNK